jgi:hypothetical protein
MIDPTKLPTTEQMNSQFMANNPQYAAPSTPPTPAPVATPNPIVAPQASYQGGVSGTTVPAAGTPEYTQAQQVATPTSTTTLSGNGTTQPNQNFTPNTATATTKTPSATDQYVNKSNEIQNQYDTALNNFQSTYEGIRTGSIPLTPYEQSQLDATRQSFQTIIDQQKVYNANLIGGTQVAQETQGLSRYSPEIAMGNIFAAQTEANKKISDLNATMQKSLAEMEQGFRQNDMKAVKDSFDELTQAKKDKQATLDKLYTVTKNEEEKAIKAGQEQTLSSINQTLLNPNINKEEKKKKIAELIASGKLTSDQMDKVQETLRQQDKDEFDRMMESNKFSYQQKQDAIENSFKAGELDLKQKNLMLDAAKAGLNPADFAPGSKVTQATTAISAEKKGEVLRTVNLVSNILNDPELKYVTGLKSPGAYFGGFFGRMYG